MEIKVHVIQKGTVYISTNNNERTQVKEFDVGQTTRNTISLNGQMAKYIKIVIKNTGWIKVNEIKVNTSVPENISTVKGGTNIGNIIDMKLFTDYNTGTAAGNAVYKTFNLTNENTIKFLKNNNSSLCVEALLDGKWEEIGTYTNMYNEIYFNEEYKQFRFSWDADSNVKFYELVTAFLKLRLIPDKSLLEDLINQANGLNSANYTKATFDGLTKALNEAKAVFNNPNATQVEVDNAKDVLAKAMADLQTVKTPVNKGDTTVSVKTGDETSLGMLMSLAGLSVLGVVYSKKKENIFNKI